MKSTLKKLGPVPFAGFTGEKIYMRPFYKKTGLPFDLARWQPTVDAMLQGIETDLPVYLMVDQAFVKGGVAHRRPGVHVDMHWCAGSQGHRAEPGRHGREPPPKKQPEPEGHVRVPPSHLRGTGNESIILASDVFGCLGYLGDYDGEPGEGGDCSAMDLSRLEAVAMTPGYAWTGHCMHMLHESIPLQHDALRTVVRLNVPGVLV